MAAGGITSSMTPEAMLAAEEADNKSNQVFTAGSAIVTNDGEAQNTVGKEFSQLGNSISQFSAKG